MSKKVEKIEKSEPIEEVAEEKEAKPVEKVKEEARPAEKTYKVPEIPGLTVEFAASGPYNTVVVQAKELQRDFSASISYPKQDGGDFKGQVTDFFPLSDFRLSGRASLPTTLMPGNGFHFRLPSRKNVRGDKVFLSITTNDKTYQFEQVLKL